MKNSYPFLVHCYYGHYNYGKNFYEIKKLQKRVRKAVKLIDKLISKDYSINCFDDLIIIRNTLGGVYDE